MLKIPDRPVLQRDPTHCEDLRHRVETILRMATTSWRKSMHTSIVEKDLLRLEYSWPDAASRQTQVLEASGATASLAFAKVPAQVEMVVNRAYARGRAHASTDIRHKTIVAQPNPLLASQTRGDIEKMLRDMCARLGVLAASQSQHKMQNHFWRSLLPVFNKTTVNRLKTIGNVGISRAYNTGKFDVYLASGVKRVGIIPEALPKTHRRHRDGAKFVISDIEFNVETAGDDRVCEECQILAEHTYDLSEVADLLPAHPNCRCALVIANI